MNKNTIEYLAYLLDKAHKEEGREKAIVFLGAGASVSAGIPLTNVIVRHIKLKFFKNPIVRDCIRDKKDDYYSLMGALTADERRDLFHFYVTRKKVKLNIANIYLAQLLKIGYVDYIVTVNFDDLILKACTLYNFLPPVYDISNIKTITTTDIRKNSVIYLHGQYFGQWLLNNNNELEKVENEVLQLFNAIKTRRTWIVVGYSGSDGIFEKIKSLGSFSNELFWVKNKFNAAEDKNVLNFIETPNLNAHKIEGYYADSFFLKLHAELSKLNESLKAPEIITKPFTFVKSVLQSINEIKDDDELNENVKKMVIICNERIDKVIAEYEGEGTEENLKQKIVDAILKENFSEKIAISFEDEIKEMNYKNVSELSWYYNDWGNSLLGLARVRNNENLFEESIKKYKKALELNPNDADIIYNLGSILLDVARQQKDENLFKESIEKFKKASEINSKDSEVLVNWGHALLELANLQNNEILYIESINKYEKASKINPKNAEIYCNWGNALLKLSKQKENINIIYESIDKYKKALEIDPGNIEALNNLGITLSNLATLQNNAILYKESIDKYKIASEIESKDSDIFSNWGNSILGLARLQDDENLYCESIDKYREASELNPNDINALNNWAVAISDLGKLKNDEVLFKTSFEKYKQALKLNSKDGTILNNWGTALLDLAKLKNDEILFKESIEKFYQASILNSLDASIFNNWGTALLDLAKLRKDETLYEESIEKYITAAKLNPTDGRVFNNLGIVLSDLANLKSDEALFKESIEKFKQSSKLNSENDSTFNNWAVALINLGKLIKEQQYFKEALEISQIAYNLGGNAYNMSCVYALLFDKNNALKYLKESLDKKHITIEDINSDDDWDTFRKDEDFINLINHYKNKKTQTMTEQHKKKTSKFLSYVLRHHPELINLNLDENGWANVDELITKSTNDSQGFTFEELDEIVETNDKKRFIFNEDKTRIRANQGHSIDINLALIPQQPSEFLYHGTAQRNIESILEKGIEKRSRQHVHLSQDKETATKVGMRHGKPIILTINTQKMFDDGIEFYLSENNVWLTDFVDIKYISQ